MSYYYVEAFNPDGDPMYSCRYGITSNPNYHNCLKCSQLSSCSWLHDYLNLKKLLGSDIAVKDKCIGRGCVECEFVARCQILRNAL